MYMESFNIFSLIVRRWITVVVITLVVFAAAYLTSRNRPVGVVSSLAVIAVPSREYPASTQLIVPNSAYEDSQLIGKLIGSWVVDPSFAQTVLGDAGAENDLSLGGLVKSFRVTGDSTVGALQVQYSSANATEAKSVATAFSTRLNKLVDTYNNLQGEGMKIHVSYGQPLINDGSGNLPLTPIVGLIAGFILAMTVAAIQEQSGKK